MQHIKFFIPFLLLILLAACESSPKVVEAENAGAQTNKPIFGDGAAATAPGANMPAATNNAEHKVVVKEVLNTDKYSYLRVEENGAETWVAITRRDIKVGSTGYYTGGLLKQNFQSKEFNRVFETVYLVADYREEGAPTSSIPAPTEALEPPKNIKAAPGAIKIADLIANIAKYNGKTVKVTGKVVKVNPMIMGRNWLHIQDGSGKNLDLTVTTTEMVELGAIVTLEGMIVTNKDFGAGYKYDYIMETAVLK